MEGVRRALGSEDGDSNYEIVGYDGAEDPVNGHPSAVLDEFQETDIQKKDAHLWEGDACHVCPCRACLELQVGGYDGWVIQEPVCRVVTAAADFDGYWGVLALAVQDITGISQLKM